jgi:hypothetical protein
LEPLTALCRKNPVRMQVQLFATWILVLHVHVEAEAPQRRYGHSARIKDPALPFLGIPRMGILTELAQSAAWTLCCAVNCPPKITTQVGAQELRREC